MLKENSSLQFTKTLRQPETMAKVRRLRRLGFRKPPALTEFVCDFRETTVTSRRERRRSRFIYL
jgi:hypothetical protein